MARCGSGGRTTPVAERPGNEVRADEEGLTPHAGPAIVGELARRTGLVGLLDGEIAANRRAAPVKQRAVAQVPSAPPPASWRDASAAPTCSAPSGRRRGPPRISMRRSAATPPRK